MIGEFRDVLAQNAEKWNLHYAGNWQVLLSNNYQPNYSTLALFWFRKGTQFPSVVTKVFGTPEIPTKEFEHLKEVHTAAPALVPRPLHAGPLGEFWTLWMEGMPGWPFQARKDSSLARLGSVADALESIHRATRLSTGSEDRHRRMVVEPLISLDRFGNSESVRAGCLRLADLCSKEWLGSLAVIPQHGDFCPNNLLSNGNRWCLLDWESYGDIDLPFYDLFTFLISVLHGGGEAPGAWSPSLAKHVPDLIRRYARGLNVDFQDMSLFLPLTLANWFHLHWVDGRREFTARLYTTIQHYFEHTDLWEEVFLRR